MSSTYYKPDDPSLVFIQSRAEIDLDLVEEYAQMMREGVQFDAVQAVADRETIYVWDGFHRGEAAKVTGQLLLVSAKPGNRNEAQWLALGANQRHGLRRSNADKRKIVELALSHPFGVELSDRQIAHHCGVSNTFVGKMRDELGLTVNGLQSTAERLGADGRTIDTANIGSNQPNYVEVWQLQQAVQQWVRQKYTMLQGQIETLEAIKQGRDEGPVLLEELLSPNSPLPTPRRKIDVIQAVNNVLNQLEAEARRLQVAEEQDEAQEWLDETAPAESDQDSYPAGYPASDDDTPSPGEEDDQPPTEAPPPPPTSQAAPAPPPPPPPPPTPRPQTPPDWLLTVTFKHTGLCLATLSEAGQSTPAANLSTHKDTVLAQVAEALAAHVPFYANGKPQEIEQ